MKIILLILLLTLAMTLYAGNTQYNLDLPKKVKGKVPVIIVCPGAGYHKDLSLFTEIRDEALKNNVACLRFNWKYYTEGRKPSEGYKEELDTIEEMIKMVKDNPAIDTKKIYLAGKSLGSVLAYQTLLKTKEPVLQDPPSLFRHDIKGLILLTPIFPDKATAEKLHPNLAQLTIDTFVIVGANDPENCDVKLLISMLADVKKNVELYVTGGDHGFNLEPWKEGVESEINNTNITNVARNTIHWIKYRKILQ